MNSVRHLLLAAAACAVISACSDSKPPPAGAPGAATTASSAPGVASTTSSGSTSASADAYDRAATGAGFTVGQMMSTHVVYVFFDPQCPHCSALWQASKPILGQVRMVWIPVTLLNPKSVKQGAVLLASKDVVPAMDAHEASISAGGGGIEPPANVPADLEEKVRANTKLMTGLGGDSVPFLVFKSPATGKPETFAGALPTASLKQLLGI